MAKLLLQLTIFITLLASCAKQDNSTVADTTADEGIKYAQLLSINHGNGFTEVKIADPWNEGSTLHTYVLVHRDSVVPANVPQGTVVRVPLERALVYSAVHTGVMKELGHIGAVAGITDASYFTDPDMVSAINNETVADCGSSMAPTIEKVINLRPDGILLSPYQDAAYGQVTQLGIPIIECADYMEFTPLGRAEWIKFYGELLGERERADSIFTAVETAYEQCKLNAANAKSKPVVLTETIYNGMWNVPGGKSYMARLLLDAGADYPWSDNDNTGSLALDFTQVLEKAQNADVWLIKSYAIHSLADLEGAYSLNSSFKAFKQGKVYSCDTKATRFFEEFPFHPEILLQEYTAIFHPEIAKDYQPRYFKPLK
ncbi:MAG: ABC transporter substrate-binding protein [Muribaculaceae bacterium]|nr:ABC transporter substrate-binding protein [Muribaculaceae bacterium]